LNAPPGATLGRSQAWSSLARTAAPFGPNISRHFQALAEKAGLPRIRLHDLRHTNASIALAAGVELKVISERLDHSTLGITADLYTRRPDRQKVCGTRIGKAFAPAAKQPRRALPSAFLARKARKGPERSSDDASPQVDVGAPEGIRTPNLLIRSQMLYPLSYGRRSRRPGPECTGAHQLAEIHRSRPLHPLITAYGPYRRCLDPCSSTRDGVPVWDGAATNGGCTAQARATHSEVR
jgi:Phage integrase family